jgi:DNA polymerase I-like protein with 3'-5' exonuclease and polymerase domains
MSTDWRPPSELPDLRGVGTVALDTETKDEGLRADRGSSWPWGDGHIAGISVAYRADGVVRAIYIPLRHPDSQNFDREQVIRWLQDLVASDVRIVTHNGLYDWGWLRTDLGIKMPPSERLEETTALATIVDENQRSYKLDALCKWRGLPGKDENLLRESCAALGLITNKRKKFKPQPYIWQLPAHLVGPYAEADPIATLALFESLDPVLDQEGTRKAYRLEVDLLPMVLEMRRRGIRIDTTAAERVHDMLLQKRDATLVELSEKLGKPVSMHELERATWLAKTFDAHGIKYPHTEKGNPSFRAGNTGWMTRHPHWLCQLKVQADRFNRAGTITLEQQILGHIVNGRVYAEIHPQRSEDGGTRSLRFSYSDPPLQQMPKHNEELGPLIRGVFLPEDGEFWAKCDVSQQEFRLLVHYAARHKLPKAREVVKRYRDDPSTDAHLLVSEWAGIERQSAKSTNYAKIYGAGVRKLAETINKPENEAREIWDKYDRELPFASMLSALAQRVAQEKGYVTLYSGARRHFNLWAPGGTWKKKAGPCGRDEAVRRVNDSNHDWHRKSLWRTDTRNALNALIQGSAAAHTKLWMREVWRESEGRIIPLLQMHDSLELSVNSPADAELVARLGCSSVEFEVPMKVDVTYGRTWGDAEHTWSELHAETSRHVEPVGEIPDAPKQTTCESPKFVNDSDDEAESAPADDIVIAVLNEGSTAEHPPWEGNPTFATMPRAIEPIQGGDGFDNYVSDDHACGKILCPLHDEKTPSCQLYADGHYHCFGCNAHGWIDDDLDIDNATLSKLTLENDTQTLESALKLWDASEPITNTLAARYLADTRKLDLAALPTGIDAVLRFHPRCPFGGNGARHPCLLALFRDVESDAPAGIHRIGLTPNAAKIKRLTLGRWPNSRAIKLWPVTHKLTIGEGIETVLGAVRCGAITPPAWAMGPKTDIANFPVLSGIKALTILVDRGDPAALDGAEMCATRYAAAGIPARWLRTVRVKDFNDLVLP